MSTAALLFCAMLVDAVLGEPKWLWSRLPHPAVVMGNIIKYCDENFNKGPAKKRNGVLILIALVLSAGALGHMLAHLGNVITILIVAILLAQKSLVQHVQAVGDALRLSLFEGRRQVAMIVGRDTGQMDQTAVARGAIESAAENLSDGVIAPAFWFLIAGLPGLLIYKIVNTADSMIGYRTEKHKDFGWAAARFDDLLNLIPARFTAMLMTTHEGLWQEWSAIRHDAKQHRSPNAGWPEAAMARALNVALAGPRNYAGKSENFPLVHQTGALSAGASDIDAACKILWKTWGCLLIITAVLAIL